MNKLKKGQTGSIANHRKFLKGFLRAEYYNIQGLPLCALEFEKMKFVINKNNYEILFCCKQIKTIIEAYFIPIYNSVL